MKESKIGDEYITDVFMNSLRECKDEQEIKALLEDRSELLSESKNFETVKGMGDTKKLDESKKDNSDDYLNAIGG